MKQTGTDVNHMVLHGRAAHPPAFSHCNHEVEFFSFPLMVSRLSGAADQVNVIAARPLLEGCGWLVGEEAVSQEDIRLPDAFDGAYADYLALQSAQGFDLTQYAGKTVQRYTYAVKNYPGLQEDIWASLLLYRDQVIGGEVFSNAGDGFLQGLAYPIQQ